MIIHQIQSDRMTAMRSGDRSTRNVLTVFLGDMQNAEKRGTTLDDAFVIQQIKKAISNADDNLKIRFNQSDEDTISVLEAYLPKQLSERELRSVIGTHVVQGASMGEIMGLLKTKYPGLYDGKLAASIAKELMS